MKWLISLLIPCCALAAAPGLPRLEWDAPISTLDYTVTNYTVYVGGTSRAYTNTYQVETNLFWNLPKMMPGKTNFYAVTATYDSYGESDLSEEVWYVPNWLPTPVITISGNVASWGSSSNVTNYTFAVQSPTATTLQNMGTNTSAALPVMTNGIWAVRVKADNHHIESRWGIKRVINVPLNVPTGKFYVEKGNTLTNWLAVSTVVGPATIWFPVNQPMEFFRFRPFFMAAANPKSGKLTKATAVMFKSKPMPVTNEPPQRILGPINLMPPKQ